MRKITLFRHIAAAITPCIYFHLHEYHITNVDHKLDIAPMQKFLKIHYLHWEKTPFCLERQYGEKVLFSSFEHMFMEKLEQILKI